MRYFLIGFLLLCLVIVSIPGFRGDKSRRPPIELFPDMDRQPKLRPQAPNGFFADGKSSRPPIAGTVARGEHFEDIPVNTGRATGTTNFVESSPVLMSTQFLERGQQRF